MTAQIFLIASADIDSPACLRQLDEALAAELSNELSIAPVSALIWEQPLPTHDWQQLSSSSPKNCARASRLFLGLSDHAQPRLYLHRCPCPKHFAAIIERYDDVL